MAIFHFSAKVISRKTGQSAVAKAAYNARERLTDGRTGEIKDYTRAEGLAFSGVYLPANAPKWAHDRQKLWNEAEAAEKRKDATLAREYEMALPHELTGEQRYYLVQDFVRENFTRKGYAADVAIHAPDQEGDQRNHHAHILVTDRRLEANGFAADKKERHLKSPERKAELEALREKWERTANRHLERHGHSERIDRRSLEAQGLDREPTQHIGPTATALERDGQETERGDINREIAARNQERERARARAQQKRDREAFYEQQRSERAYQNSLNLTPEQATIRQCYNAAMGVQSFEKALDEAGYTLARVSRSDVEKAKIFAELQTHIQDAPDWKKHVAIKEGDLLVIDNRGYGYRLTERTTGATPRDIAGKMGETATPLPSIQASREKARQARAEEKARQEREYQRQAQHRANQQAARAQAHPSAPWRQVRPPTAPQPQHPDDHAQRQREDETKTLTPAAGFSPAGKEMTDRAQREEGKTAQEERRDRLLAYAQQQAQQREQGRERGRERERER